MRQHFLKCQEKTWGLEGHWNVPEPLRAGLWRWSISGGVEGAVSVVGTGMNGNAAQAGCGYK